MNVFNRTFLGLYSLLWFGACVGLIAMAWNTNQKLDINLGSFNLQAFIISDTADRWVFTAIVGLFGAVGLITFFTAFRASLSVRPDAVRVRRNDGTLVDVGTGVVESLMRDEIEALPDVRQAKPIVRAKSGVVESEITVSVEPFTDIADISDEVSAAVADVLRHQVGAQQARRPVLHITYDELAANPVRRPRGAQPLQQRPPSAGAPIPPPPAAGPRPTGPAAPSRDRAALPPPPPPPATPGPLLGEASGVHSTAYRLTWRDEAGQPVRPANTPPPPPPAPRSESTPPEDDRG